MSQSDPPSKPSPVRAPSSAPPSLSRGTSILSPSLLRPPSSSETYTSRLVPRPTLRIPSMAIPITIAEPNPPVVEDVQTVPVCSPSEEEKKVNVLFIGAKEELHREDIYAREVLMIQCLLMRSILPLREMCILSSYPIPNTTSYPLSEEKYQIESFSGSVHKGDHCVLILSGYTDQKQVILSLLQKGITRILCITDTCPVDQWEEINTVCSTTKGEVMWLSIQQEDGRGSEEEVLVHLMEIKDALPTLLYRSNHQIVSTVIQPLTERIKPIVPTFYIAAGV